MRVITFDIAIVGLFALFGCGGGVSQLVGVRRILEEKRLAFAGPKPLHASHTGIELTDPNGNKADLLQRR